MKCFSEHYSQIIQRYSASIDKEDGDVAKAIKGMGYSILAASCTLSQSIDNLTEELGKWRKTKNHPRVIAAMEKQAQGIDGL